MSDRTGIQWTDATWNPWMGCAKVSPACAHCYMFDEQRQYGHDPSVVRRSKTLFRAPLRWQEPRLVFTCSWSDWFIEAADEWRDEAWDVIRRTPHLTYQILTKRPELIPDRLPADWGSGWAHVWLGVSIENRRFTWRADLLRAVPAAVRFISAEPLLGPLESLDLAGLDWLISGGESGPKARRTNPDWLAELRDRCRTERVAYFVKQVGRRLAIEWGLKDRRHGGDISEWPAGLRVREMPRAYHRRAEDLLFAGEDHL